MTNDATDGSVAVKPRKKRKLSKDVTKNKEFAGSNLPQASEGAQKRRRLKTAAGPNAARSNRPESGEATAKAFRSQHAISVRGTCPAPAGSFQQARSCLGDDLVKGMEEQGYSAPTPIQAQAWPIAVRGHDLVAVAKTGSGKTCGYLLPALALIAKRGPTQSLQHKKGLDQRPPAQPSCLIMAPTRELVQQIGKEAKKFAGIVGARVLGIFGGVPKGPQVSALRAGIDMLVATPGRLRDFMTGDQSKAPVVLVDSVTFLVLDEADRMLDMGFEPEIRQIIAQCPAAGSAQETLSGEARQTLFFTATWPPDVQRSALHFTHHALRVEVGQSSGKGGGGGLATNTSIKQTVKLVKEEEKLMVLKQVIRSDLKPGETCMVFTGRKQTCDALEKELTWDPMRPEAPICAWCRALHGDKESQTCCALPNFTSDETEVTCLSSKSFKADVTTVPQLVTHFVESLTTEHDACRSNVL
ncbi:DEAD-box ATP-dependent RNA helicase 14 [Durusdinium trenchii]|uniref:DEAD-box ATP-dependent RNA helicase 14 n=1 Tax=Durusdinium trenchii TaxID=1381693 RepID=A0ABP0PAI0_9DINO